MDRADNAIFEKPDSDKGDFPKTAFQMIQITDIISDEISDIRTRSGKNHPYSKDINPCFKKCTYTRDTSKGLKNMTIRAIWIDVSGSSVYWGSSYRFH